MSEEIICCEPQCQGFEHAAFNASLLETLRYAYPKGKIIFFAEREHISWVKETLSKASNSNRASFESREMAIPDRRLNGWVRFGKELPYYRYVLMTGAAMSAKLMVMCSSTDTGLFILKALMRLQAITAPTLVVLHGQMLNSIPTRQPRRPWNWVKHPRQVLRYLHPKNLRYILLGSSIYDRMRKIMPSAGRYFSVIDHPGLWPRDGIKKPPMTSPSHIRFGFFGAGVRGTGTRAVDTFLRLAQETYGQLPNAQFIMVGFLKNVADFEGIKGVTGLSTVPLSSEEYSKRASGLDFALGTAVPTYYELSASSSFLDALSFLKPVICLRNRYIEHYFDRMGDIGYMCDSYEELKDTIVAVAQEFPLERYRHQWERMLQGRHIFEPQNVAPNLRAIVEAMESRAEVPDTLGGKCSGIY